MWRGWRAAGSCPPRAPPLRPWVSRWGSIAALPWPQQLPFYSPRAGERMPNELAFAMLEQVAAAEQAEAAGD